MSMLPPQSLPDSQESNATTTSSTSARSFPGNAYAPASVTDPTPPSSQSGHSTYTSSQQSNDEPSHKQPKSSVNAAAAPANHAYPPRTSPVERTSSSSSPSSSRTAQSPTTHGSKRTASGAIKSPVSAHPISPGVALKYGHNRNTSLDTTTSSVGELSAQLKSRLSHAMTKVNQNRLYGSPSQPTSYPTSPAYTNSNSNGYTTTAQSKTKTLSQVLHEQQSRYPDGSYQAQHQARAAESYERGQPMTLAPAPSLMPSASSQRRTTGAGSVPRLKTHNSNGASDALGIGRAETPTQQEQEAVDTLIFMSSPANSSRYPRESNGVTSPKREAFHQRAGTNGYHASVSGHGGYGSSAQAREAKRRGLGAGAVRSERDVDRMLDRMASESSLSEGERRERSRSPVCDDGMGPPPPRGQVARVNGYEARRL